MSLKPFRTNDLAHLAKGPGSVESIIVLMIAHLVAVVAVVLLLHVNGRARARFTAHNGYAHES